MASTTIEVTQSQAATLTFTFKNPDGSDFDLSGCTVRLVVAPKRGSAPILDRAGDITGNAAAFVLTEDDTDVDIRAYTSTLTLTNSGGVESVSRIFYLYVTDVQVSDGSATIVVGDNTVGISVDVTPPSASGDKHFEVPFNVSSTVTVQHNLGKFPSVTVIDSAGDECVGDIQHLSNNELMLTFSAPFSGKVFCN